MRLARRASRVGVTATAAASVAATASSSRSSAKVLCLHGGGTNAAIMRLQTAKLRAQLRGDCEFEFLEGVVPMVNVDPAVKARFGGPYVSWYDVTHNAYEGVRSPESYVQALMDERVTFTYPGAKEAMAQVEQHIESHGPYHTLLGFSQGAILITLLTAARLARSRAGGEAEYPSWKQNVLVCGMPVRAEQFSSYFTAPLDFPCIVAQGLQDPAYEWCTRLKDVYAAPTYLEFPDGHRFPHSREDTTTLADAMRSHMGILPAAGDPTSAGDEGSRGHG